MNVGEIIKSIGGGVLALFGFLLLIGIAQDIGKDSLGLTISGGLMAFAAIGGGGFLIRNAYLGSKKRRFQEIENMVLRVASMNQGKLTVALLAMQANISTQDAETMLNTMQQQGFAEIQVDERGVIFYEFTSLLR